MHRRTVLKTGLLAPVALAPLALTAAPADAVLRKGRTLARGLDYPWGCDFLPDGSALVTQRNSGQVVQVGPDGGHTVVGTVPGAFNDGGEGGLLGLAVSPTYASDQLVYAYLTTRTDNRVVRMPFADGALGAVEEVLTGIPRHETHNGGGLLFRGTDDLFVTTGDNRHPRRAQDLDSLRGKILRMTPDGQPHPGNPYAGGYRVTNRAYVFTHGHRNVEGITLGPNGRIWASELGENTWDELNWIRRGRNYGWADVEGTDGPGGYTNPFVQWHTDECSPSGVAVTHGRAYVGALRGECLWSVELGGSRARTKVRHFHGRFGRIRMVKLAPDGRLWIGTSNGNHEDKIIRLRFA